MRKSSVTRYERKHNVMIASVLDVIGKTPLIRLRKVASSVAPAIFAKAEMLNPGGSTKDRIAKHMIEDAEARGLIREGGTIVEPTIGNTGIGLAIVAAVKGYKAIFVMPDKVCQDKIAVLQAYGAEIILAPTNVPTASPDSYLSVARRIASEMPGAFMPDQFSNAANPITHYAATGPEIWEQTEGKVGVLVSGLGSGGAISGTGKYLKEKNPKIIIVGADPQGSILSGGPSHSYQVEGVGQNFIPDVMTLSLIDFWVRVGDREAFLMARRIAREEGLLVGGSSGLALCAALDVCATLDPSTVVVVLFMDTGRNYLSKIYCDAWMKKQGFLD